MTQLGESIPPITIASRSFQPPGYDKRANRGAGQAAHTLTSWAAILDIVQRDRLSTWAVCGWAGTNQGNTMDMQPPAAPTGAPAGPDAEPAGFVVCIQCNPDGTFMVGLDSPEAEAAEQPGQPEPGMSPAKDVKDALTMALQIIKTNGNASQGQSDFNAGMNEPMAR